MKFLSDIYEIEHTTKSNFFYIVRIEYNNQQYLIAFNNKISYATLKSIHTLDMNTFKRLYRYTNKPVNKGKKEYMIHIINNGIDKRRITVNTRKWKNVWERIV